MLQSRLYITRTTSLRLAIAAALIVALVPAWSVPAEAGSFGGRAFSAFINLPSVGAGPIYVADTGTLTPTGGWDGESLLETDSGVLSAETLVTVTSGANYSDVGDRASSSASLSRLVMLPGSPAEVTAAFVRAAAETSDTAIRGATEISQLTFGGVPVVVTGAANQTVAIPLVATLVINEQSLKADPLSGAREITVNALRLRLASGEEIVVSSAASSISR